MTDEIFIPPEASLPKPWWTTRPTAERIKEILEFIQRSRKPYLWPGQTYDKPSKDSFIDYLAEFHLPPSSPLVPCPCCTPKHPKYRHGMIAHFPNESIIRIMGHDCFKSINSAGHTEALRKYHRELQKKKDIAYLLDNLDKVPELIAVAEQASPVGHAIDDFRNRACKVFSEVLRTDLWEHIRSGELRISTVRTQTIQIPGLGEDTREVSITETYGRIAGQDFLKLRAPKLGLKLDNIILALQQINFGPKYKERVAELSDQDRHHTARLLGKSFKTASEVFASIHELRQFTSQTTIATLNGWAKIPECPVHMMLVFEGTSLLIGKRDHEFRRIEVPAAYSLVLRQIPAINVKSVAA